jgi:hypothetical protein
VKSPVKISVVRSDVRKGKAQDVRREIFHYTKAILAEAGEKISGYAVVVWDTDGHNWTVFKGGAPIQSRMIPSFASDALQQHVVVNMVAEDKGK